MYGRKMRRDFIPDGSFYNLFYGKSQKKQLFLSIQKKFSYLCTVSNDINTHTR